MSRVFLNVLRAEPKKKPRLVTQRIGVATIIVADNPENPSITF